MVDRSKKISELPLATTVANTDFVIIVANTTGTANTKRISSNNFRNSITSTFTSNVATITTITANVINVANLVFTDQTTQNTAFKWSNTPANSSANGVAGLVAYDSNYLYVCVANNTWKRITLGSY